MFNKILGIISGALILINILIYSNAVYAADDQKDDDFKSGELELTFAQEGGHLNRLTDEIFASYWAIYSVAPTYQEQKDIMKHMADHLILTAS